MGLSEPEAWERLRQAEAAGHTADLAGPLTIARCEGELIAVSLTEPTMGVRLEREPPIVFHGALGKLVPALGLPISGERILGSSWRGRYQEFERGVGNWEVLRDAKGNAIEVKGAPVPNFGFPILMGEYSPKRGENVNALVAFFDVRGFTKWSSKAEPGDVQEIVMTLEIAFQDAFEPNKATQIFAKGTGDGFMLVSEAPWWDATKVAIQANHAKDFVARCKRTVSGAAATLDEKGLTPPLAVGCAVTTGELTRVYILGRYDYLGTAVNRAAKLQGTAENAVRVDDGVRDLLGGPDAQPVECNNEKGWELPPG